MIDRALRFAFVGFIFWPWMLVVVEVVRWFFFLPLLFAWDSDRAGMAFIWPIPAFLVVMFLLWVWD